MTTLWFFSLFIVGLFGSIYLARKYNLWVTRLLLVFIGGMSLWIVLVGFYALAITSPVPHILGLGVFPIGSLIVMAVIIQKMPKIDSKEKRKIHDEYP